MNVGVLSVPNDRLAICERLQVQGRQPLGYGSWRRRLYFFLSPNKKITIYSRL